MHGRGDNVVVGGAPSGYAGRVLRLSRNAALAGAAMVMFVASSSGALAQNCGALPFGGALGFGTFNFIGIVATGVSASGALSSSVTAANTGFLTQSTAFVGAPANPKPDSEGGGIWVRGVGGTLDLKNSSTINATVVAPGVGGVATNSTTCNTKYRQDFSGFQVGADVAKLNVMGWNVHIGTTAGALETKGSIVGGSPSGGISGGIAVPTTQVPFGTTGQSPFVGTYAVATKGDFFIDGLVRYDYYDTTLNSPGSNLFGQKADAHGISISGSAGYNWKVPNANWFIEPSAGLIYSRVQADSLNVLSPFGGPNNPNEDFSGTARVDTMTSLIGRAGLRVGTSIATDSVIWQPFAAASIWHEFGGSITSSFSTCPNCFFFGGGPNQSTSASITTSNIGTFGQFSAGVAGKLVNSGWLGFVRVDYRTGSNIEGLSGTGGIRYQFEPGPERAAMPVKAPAPVAAPVNWTGLYIGGIGGADYGRGNLSFPGVTSTGPHTAGVLGGGTLGYNYQIGKWVVGVEGDGAWTNARGSQSCGALTDGAVVVPLFQTTCHDELNWIATATARLGYAWGPRTLLYAKAGGAWARETFSVTCNLGPLNGVGLQNCASAAGTQRFDQASASDTRVGWTVGFGTEFALTSKWSAKGEFDYMDFGSKTLTLSDGTAVNTTQRIAQGKIGLNYKLAP